MNHPVKGYFCLVQYCPDLARREVANVGVLLFSPEHDFLEARLVTGNQRVPANEIVAASQIETLHVLRLQQERTTTALVGHMPE